MSRNRASYLNVYSNGLQNQALAVLGLTFRLILRILRGRPWTEQEQATDGN